MPFFAFPKQADERAMLFRNAASKWDPFAVMNKWEILIKRGNFLCVQALLCCLPPFELNISLDILTLGEMRKATKRPFG
jgi:hypothetical protein